MGTEMNCSKDTTTKTQNGRILIAGVKLILACTVLAALTGCEKSIGTAHPVEGAEVVVERFYEYISEAKIKGGTTPLREAYKLISSDKSRLSQAKFMEIASKYPPGFKADITGMEINGSKAIVTIAYRMPSAFEAYTINTDIPLSVDKATNTWKIDFTGETDGQEKSIDNKGPQ